MPNLLRTRSVNRSIRLNGPSICLASVITMLAAPLAAIEFQLGEVDANLDTTVSVGGSYRLNDPDPDLYGLTSGGNQYSVNADNGNLNYRKGWFSQVVKATSELELRYKNFGGFVRATAFYDFENEDDDRARTPLSNKALEQVGSDIDLLDAYVWATFDAGAMPVDIRLGSQVLSWGESTFIQNGINVINPVDVSKLRIPGAELREGLTPVPMISASIGLTDNITVEGFYLFKFEQIEIDPPGTYFSTNDFAGLSGSQVFLGFGSIPDDTPFGAIPRAPNNNPKDTGQFGLAMRILVPSFNDTEFGFYYIRYHSRLPLISAITPTDPINVAAVPGIVASLVPGLLMQGYDLATAQAIAIDTASTIVFLESAATGRYVIGYPEDIDMFGFSWNTDLGNTGISFQGEVSYRDNQPVQVDDVELLFAALSAINPQFAEITGLGATNQLGNYAGQLNTPIDGYRRTEMWQLQATTTKIFGPNLGADQIVLLGEFGATWIDIPDKDTLRFDGPATFTSGQPLATQVGLSPVLQEEGFADDFSWGYRLAARFDYNNLFWGINAMPSISFQHDVNGTTPLPIGNFVEGRKSISLGVEFIYQNSWSYSLRYTSFFGAGDFNLINDRDFISTTLKYSF